MLRRYVVGPRVLDVGCSHGAYVDHLAQRGFDVTGVDFVAGFLRQARRHGRSGTFAQADANGLPFRDRSFDTTLLFDILEHMPDEAAVLREAARVTTRRIVLIVPRTTEPALERHGLVFRHHLDRTHLRTYTAERSRALFPRAAVHIDELDRVSVKHAMLSLVESAPVRSLLRLLLRPCDISTNSEHLIVVDLPDDRGGVREEAAA